MDFNNKKILLISTAFFGYENKISNKLREMGANVDYYDERSVTSALARAVLKVVPQVFKNKTHKYYEKIVADNSNKEYDYVFCNGFSMLDKTVVDLLKDTFSKATFIIYLADSVRGNKKVEGLFGLFDKVVTFDRQDYIFYKEKCKLNNVYFRPLYYADCYCDAIESPKKENEFVYDICFIGTIHSDRYRVIKELRTWAENTGRNFFAYCYLQSKFMYYFYKVTNRDFRHARKSEFRFDKISSEVIVDIVDKSRAVLDVQYPKNSGLTMRTIEMLGMRKKLITSNNDICNYDFYDKENIYIIDRNNPVIDVAFFETKYKEIPDEVYKRYSMKSWLKDIFG